jgi:hypothetical protein
LAKLKAFTSVDMTDLSTRIGTATHADDRLLVISIGLADTYYYGRFEYPGGSWRGTINKVFEYYDGRELWHVTGLELSTRYATVGTTREAAFRKAFAGDDVLNGSGGRDALLAYSGNDLMRGGRGSDALNGATGHDRVFGQAGNDLLVGGDGRDRLAGGGGNDRLRGGDLRDVFVFGGADGRDRVIDFADGVDRFEILGGADRFRDLELAQRGEDVLIAFAATQIVVADTEIGELGARDFLF